MTSSAVTSLAWSGLAVTGVLFGAALVAPGALAQAQSNRCAIYGSGFVEVHGGDSCVRIGGRVRVDAGIVGAGGIFAPAPKYDFTPGAPNGLDREHVRVPGSAPQNGMPRTR